MDDRNQDDDGYRRPAKDLALVCGSTMNAASGAYVAVLRFVDRSAARISPITTRYFSRSLGRRASSSGSTAKGKADRQHAGQGERRAASAR